MSNTFSFFFSVQQPFAEFEEMQINFPDMKPVFVFPLQAHPEKSVTKAISALGAA